MFKYAIVIPTYNAGEKWIDCIKAIKKQTIPPTDALVVDSTSEDKTVDIAKENGLRVFQITKEDFNHGRTRQKTLQLLEDSDVVIFLTQDAILADSSSIETILSFFRDKIIENLSITG